MTTNDLEQPEEQPRAGEEPGSADETSVYDESTADEPTGRRITRRGFVAGTSALGLGSFALYRLFGRSSSTPSADSTPGDGPSDSGATLEVTVDPDKAPEAAVGSAPTPSGEPWSSRYSANEGDVVIDSEIVLDLDARVRSLKIEESGTLTMTPNSSVTLISAGNVEVLGTLVLRPATPAQIHTLRFEGVDESAYQGGGRAVVGSDVGLWVAHGGLLVAEGATKNAWGRAGGSLSAGATTLAVDNADGWQVGDRLAIAPTIAPTIDDGKFHQDGANAQAYDEVSVVAISGNEITVDQALEHDHPTISFTRWDGSDRTYGAEVLNLTRNVVIAGTEQGRAHVLFLASNRQQNLTSVQFDQLGPRQSAGANNAGTKIRTEGVSGRYPFHMHHCGNGVQGSVIKDCVVTNSGNRAFVPHESHGVTLERCVAHDIHGTAFWWDQPGRHNPTGEKPKTHDSLWTGCVASKVWADQLSENGYRLAGFNLSDGNHGSNKLIDSVAVGVFGERVTNNTGNRSGFHWTEHGQAVWVFENCLAHNIGGNGILTWQNDEEVHVIEDFTAYHCASHGIEHGAYSNFYQYIGLTLVGNRLSGIGCHAVTRRTNSVRRAWTDQGKQAPIITFKDVWIDGRGITVDGVRGLSHRFAAEQPNGPTLFENFHVEGCTRAGLFEGDGKNAAYYILRNWQVEDSQAVMLDSGAPGETRIDVANLNGSPDEYTMTT